VFLSLPDHREAQKTFALKLKQPVSGASGSSGSVKNHIDIDYVSVSLPELVKEMPRHEIARQRGCRIVGCQHMKSIFTADFAHASMSPGSS
jgi:hypothetical protein